MNTERALEIVAAAHASGMTYKAIAERLRCSPDTIRKWRERPDGSVNRAIAANLVVLDADVHMGRD